MCVWRSGDNNVGEGREMGGGKVKREKKEKKLLVGKQQKKRETNRRKLSTGSWAMRKEERRLNCRSRIELQVYPSPGSCLLFSSFLLGSVVVCDYKGRIAHIAFQSSQNTKGVKIHTKIHIAWSPQWQERSDGFDDAVSPLCVLGELTVVAPATLAPSIWWC